MGRISGIVLCGGRSVRMGRPKAELLIAGEPLLVRVVRVVSGVTGAVVVVAAAGQDLPPLPAGVRVVRDECPGEGPLRGLAAGLAAIDAGVAFVASCDLPLLRAEFVRRVVESIGEFEACVPDVDGRRHPLCAAYRTDVRAAVGRMLGDGRRRMTELAAEVRTRFLGAEAFADVGVESLRNVNTPAEWAEVSGSPLPALRERGWG